MGAALGVVGVGAAVDAQAQPGPFPQWCPGDFWDPGWGDNWEGGVATTTGGVLGQTRTPSSVAGMTIATADGTTAEIAGRTPPPKGGGVLYFVSTPSPR